MIDKIKHINRIPKIGTIQGQINLIIWKINKVCRSIIIFNRKKLFNSNLKQINKIINKI